MQRNCLFKSRPPSIPSREKLQLHITLGIRPDTTVELTPNSDSQGLFIVLLVEVSCMHLSVPCYTRSFKFPCFFEWKRIRLDGIFRAQNNVLCVKNLSSEQLVRTVQVTFLRFYKTMFRVLVYLQQSLFSSFDQSPVWYHAIYKQLSKKEPGAYVLISSKHQHPPPRATPGVLYLLSAQVKSVQSALSDLKRPPERLQSQCNYRPFIT